MTNEAPLYMNDMLKLSENKTHRLRSETNKNLMLQIKPRTNFYKKSFSYNSIMVWNSVPISIKTSRNVRTLKSNYKKSYLNDDTHAFTVEIMRCCLVL